MTRRRLRPARPADVPEMLAVKAALRFTDAGSGARGGFLLGSDAEGYLQRIAVGSAWVLEGAAPGRLEGFAIVLPDAVFRASEVWQRRAAVCWSGADPEVLSAHRLCYYDQLAVRRGRFGLRRWSAALAMTALAAILDEHDFLVTSTVRAPVRNLAAVGFIERLGGRVVGQLDEHYPDVGALVSDIWLVERGGVRAYLREPGSLAGQWMADQVAAALAEQRT